MSEIFSSVQQAAEALRPALTAVSKAIFDHPELGKEEVFASGQHCARIAWMARALWVTAVVVMVISAPVTCFSADSI